MKKEESCKAGLKIMSQSKKEEEEEEEEKELLHTREPYLPANTQEATLG